MRKKSKGFTLIELLVVIAIIGLLATIVLVSLNNARQKARNGRRVSDLRQIALALEMYYDDNPGTGYPNGGDAAVGCNDWADLSAKIAPNYISGMPADPGGGSVAYAYESDAADYVLRAQLEAGGMGSLLATDVDGTALSCDCADASRYYCIEP